MTSAAKKILDEALALPHDERRNLVEILLASMPAETIEAAAAWYEEQRAPQPNSAATEIGPSSVPSIVTRSSSPT